MSGETSDTSLGGGTFEHFFQCPYCWETISMVLDLSEPSQSYVEDCEVCCQPIEIHYESSAGDLTQFNAMATD
jgi:transcription elongation factor Elf1